MATSTLHSTLPWALESAPSGPDSGLRREAWGQFQRQPWPRLEDEAWRRTDISGLDFEAFRLRSGAESAIGEPPEGLANFSEGTEASLLAGDDGIFRHVPEELAERGVLFMSLGEALKTHSGLVLPRLGRLLPAEKGKWEALALALWNRGYFVYVPKDVDVTVPLRAGFGSDPGAGESVIQRGLIVAEAGARVTVIEDHFSGERGDGEAASVGATEIFIGENAEVTYLHLARHGRGTYDFFSQNARLAASARLTSLVIGLGGQLVKGNFGSELAEPGATSRLYGLVFGEGSQQFTHHTWQNHQAPNTTSDLLFKAALMGEARSVYTGLIRIEKAAQKANAYQASKNILLSKGARANAIPMLEILANDVKCGHGAAVGSLDDDQRFYLMSRGLAREEAEQIIVEGFFEEVLEKVPMAGLHERLRQAIDRKLADASHG